MNKTRKIVLCALLIAADVILSRTLSIRTPIISIDFYFVPIVLASIILGPKYSTFIATISDIIGALLFPVGSYFFGFTITAFLTGLTFGLLLYRKEFKIDKSFIIRLIISTIIVTVLINGVINTIWIMMIVKDASKIVVPIRILKQLILAPVIVITTLSLGKILNERINKFIND